MRDAFWLVVVGLSAVPDWLMWALIAATVVALGAIVWAAAWRPQRTDCACGSAQGGGAR